MSHIFLNQNDKYYLADKYSILMEFKYFYCPQNLEVNIMHDKINFLNYLCVKASYYEFINDFCSG